jgi:hypothetical protein
MTWLEDGRAYILTLEIPADATLKDTRRIFREKGHNFHGGTCWGRKAWGKATREFQRSRGLIPQLPPPSTPAHLFAADIIFPFRDPA